MSENKKTINPKKEQREAKLFAIVVIGAWVLIILFIAWGFLKTPILNTIVKLQPVFNYQETDISNAVEYDPAEGALTIWNGGMGYISPYPYAEVFVNGRKMVSEELKHSGSELVFRFHYLCMPTNELFDLAIDFYDDRGDIAETIVAKDICLVDDLSVVENPEDVRLFFYSWYTQVDMDELLRFKNIENLHLNFEEFDGDIARLYELENLKFIWVHNCSKNLPSPDTLAQMTGLEHLHIDFDLYGTDFDTSIFKKLVNLKTLQSYDTAPQGDYDNFKYLQNLENLKLTLDADDTEKLNVLQSLPNLKKLYLSFDGEGEINLEYIAKLTNLQSLRLQGDAESQCDVDVLSDLTNLEYLFLSSIGDYTGDMDFISEFKDLEFLFIGVLNSENMIDISVLNNLPKLEKVYLYNINGLEGNMQSLSELEELYSLSFKNCSNITSDNTDFSSFENLEFISIDNCRELNLDLDDLLAAEKLENIYIKSCPKVYGDFSGAENLSNLKEITIIDCDNITGNPTFFRKMDGVEFVRLDPYINEDGKLENFRLPKK